MNKHETICAVVVTYNRKHLLLECLEAIRKQTRPVQAIYIIDNHSIDGTPELLLEKGYINQLPPPVLTEPWEIELSISNQTNSEPIEIHYIRMHENTGGAGGFHEGLKRAYEKGYDWFWLMDDDVEPITEALDIQLKYEDISLCIHPSKKYTDGELYVWEGYIDEGSGHCFHKKEEEFRKEKNWTCVNTGCFEGMLIHRKVVSKIGFPLKELFTYSDDTYYGYLASKVTQNIYISEICFIKKIKPSQERLFLPNYIYLYSRNYLGYVARKITKNKKIYYVMTFSIILNLIIKFLIRSRYDSIFWLLLGYIHGLNENWSFYKSYFSKKTVQRGQF